MSVRLEPILDLPQEVQDIAQRLTNAGFETWCVGGALRDWLLEHPSGDFDLATAATPEQVQQLFPHTVAVGIKYGTVGVLDRHRSLHEVTTFRKDVTTDGRHAVVEYGASLEEDLARRDFTINALAYHPLRQEWRDPFGGAQDLDGRVIRAVGDPARRFAEDYLRILRAIRFSARFGFMIDADTWKAAIAGASGLRHLSAERVRDEWVKGLESAKSVQRLVELWREVGAAAIWLPELLPTFPLASASPDPRDPIVLTAALCSDAAAALARLRSSNAELARVRAIAAAPPPPEGEPPGAVAVRRWLSRVGDAVGDLQSLARVRTGEAPAWAAVVAGIQSRREATSRGQLAVSGHDLSGAGVPSGPELGRLLSRLLDAVLDDPSLNTRDRLLEMVRAWK